MITYYFCSSIDDIITNRLGLLLLRNHILQQQNGQIQWDNNFMTALSRNKIMFTFFGFKLFHLAEISSPALEKSLSAGTEVPGMHRYFFASSGSLTMFGDFPSTTSEDLQSWQCSFVRNAAGQWWWHLWLKNADFLIRLHVYQSPRTGWHVETCHWYRQVSRRDTCFWKPLSSTTDPGCMSFTTKSTKAWSIAFRCWDSPRTVQHYFAYVHYRLLPWERYVQ